MSGRGPRVQWCMRFLSIAAVLLASVSGLGSARDKPKPDGEDDAQRCAPKVLSPQIAPPLKTRYRPDFAKFMPSIVQVPLALQCTL